jgi:hypothetical protein
VKGEVYSLVNEAKAKFPQSKIVLSGVMRRTDVSWRRSDMLNGRYNSIAKTFRVTFIDTEKIRRTQQMCSTDFFCIYFAHTTGWPLVTFVDPHSWLED